MEEYNFCYGLIEYSYSNSSVIGVLDAFFSLYEMDLFNWLPITGFPHLPSTLYQDAKKTAVYKWLNRKYAEAFTHMILDQSFAACVTNMWLDGHQQVAVGKWHVKATAPASYTECVG